MKPRSQLSNRVFARRVVLLAGVKVALMSGLIGRMYYLQVIEADRFRAMSDKNRIDLRLLRPLRGRIVDRFGRPIAVNEPSYRIVVVPEETGDMRATLEALARILPLGADDIDRLVHERQRFREFVPIAVRENLSWDQVSRINVNLPDLPGTSVEVDQERGYPFGGSAGEVLGYVGKPADSEIGNDSDPLLKLPGFRIGKAGLEKVYDTQLRGTPGISEVEVNAYGRVVRELIQREAKPGVDLVTSIDIGLQQFVQQRLSAERSASAVVLDVTSGDVLALSSSPGFDPSALSRGLSTTQWESMANDAARPLSNKAIAGLYPPGSTFKTMTALAALAAGIEPSHATFCPGFLSLGNAIFHCWWRQGHGTLDMLGGIKHSCDVYFYDLAQRIGIDTIATMARRFGLGQMTGIDLPGEKAGLVPDAAWKRTTMHDVWHPGESLIAGIGQGFILTTPLQIAVMVARIANGGYALRPRMVRTSATGPDPRVPRFPRMDLDLTHLKLVAEGMRMVVNDPEGTAYGVRISQPGMEMAGKSGSAQVRRITMAERLSGVRKNEDLPWPMRDHALFIAFAPLATPRYATAVVVEHGGGGSKVAGQIAHDILLECQIRDPIRPRAGHSLAQFG